MDQIHMGPVKFSLNNAQEMVKHLSHTKQWFYTIYGIAGLAQNEQSISKLYEIKQRDSIKPLAICLSKPDEIVNWAHTQDLPKGLINAIITRTYYSNIKKKRQSK
ncbi:hypothetical protein TKK_0000709 [Trichogramma kaykai]